MIKCGLMLCSDHGINDMYVPSIKIAKQCQKFECFGASFVKYVPHEGLVHSVIETKMIIHSVQQYHIIDSVQQYPNIQITDNQIETIQ